MSISWPALSQEGLLAGIDQGRLPALVAAAGERAGIRFLEFFASTLRNPHTRRAYARAVTDFLAWCEAHAVRSIEGRAAAARRHLFDWLVMGQVVPLNPAASVRGPAHSVRKGKTPVLDPAKARTLLDSIDISTPIGLRDRALIALMVYSFRRIGAVLAMKVEDVFVQNRRLWVRLREKGGERHEMPAIIPWKSICTPIWTVSALPANPRGRWCGAGRWRRRSAPGLATTASGRRGSPPT